MLTYGVKENFELSNASDVLPHVTKERGACEGYQYEDYRHFKPEMMKENL
jgi:hypothetical protein